MTRIVWDVSHKVSEDINAQILLTLYWVLCSNLPTQSKGQGGAGAYRLGSVGTQNPRNEAPGRIPEGWGHWLRKWGDAVGGCSGDQVGALG